MANNVTKTPATVLQELMIKLGQTPEYNCISQYESRTRHASMFEYQCSARGAVSSATARCKKDAKQEAARRMLLALSERGYAVPPPWATPNAVPQVEDEQIPQLSYVHLLRNLTLEYRIPAVEYELVGDTGPPHQRLFTMCSKTLHHRRTATAASKKSARQLAAKQLFDYLRDTLVHDTNNSSMERAHERANEHAMKRYVEARDDFGCRLNLGQLIADYHLGLVRDTDAEKCELARKTLEKLNLDGTVEEGVLEDVVAKLGLTLKRSLVPSESRSLCRVVISPTSPSLTFVGHGRQDCDTNALTYLKLVLSQNSAN